ncbi:MAG: cyclic nucleotide-binding domain-containing protein [Candidatus Wallbacteria bacterium]|nr:cyclic nucleotide-binding domain-containing protein [Candidatus Wallbacteria bacterium]
MLDGNFLEGSAIFKGIEHDAFETITFVVEDVTIPNGHFLFKEGAAARSLFIIRDGEIEIVKESGTGPVTLATLGEGEIFGEMAVIRDTPRSSAARAKGHTSLWTIQREKLDTLRRKDPVLWGTLMHNIAGILADRLAAVTARLTSTATGGAAAPEAAEKSFWARLTGH